MEDSHIAKFEIAKDIHVFGVFDGHGGTSLGFFMNWLGKEVARFTERHFIDELTSNKAFKETRFSQALTETFLKIDQLLLSPEGKKELMVIKSGDDDSKVDYQPVSA